MSSFGMGGQERVALDLALGQRRLGHRVLAVSLAAGPEGPLGEQFRSFGIEVATLPKGDGFDLSLVRRLAAFARQQRLRLFHTHNPQPLIYGAFAARLAGIFVVHTKHGANPDAGRKLWLRRAAGHLTRHYVAVSEETAAIARANRECFESQLRVIKNGIDLSRFVPNLAARSAVRTELGIPESAFVVGTVARLAPEKEHVFLIRSIARLLGEQCRLVLVGDGAERQRIEQAVESEGVSAFVHMTGARHDVPRLLSSFDAFVMSSRTEGLPLVLPEAMACGLPVLSTAVGGIPSIVDDGATGYLVPAQDASALADGLRRLAENRQLCREFGARAREVALERYSAERMLHDYLALYQGP